MSTTPSPATPRTAASSSYHLFTVAPDYIRGELVVSPGAEVTSVAIKAAGSSIPAIVVGEQGKGRDRAVLPCPAVPAGERLMAATIGPARSGKPRLFAPNDDPSNMGVIIVFRTPMGHRGGNAHWGDRPNTPFPGEILARGRIAQGDAGRMGSGYQFVALLQDGDAFTVRVFSDGRSRPQQYIGCWNGGRLAWMLEEEQELLLDAGEDAVSDLEPLRAKLRKWQGEIRREQASFRNSALVSRVRNQVEQALRGGGQRELEAARQAILGLPNHNGKWVCE